MREAVKIGRDSVILAFGRIFSYVLGFLVTIILTRNLTPDDFGIYAYVLSIATLLYSTAELCFNIGIFRFVPEYMAKGEGGKAKSVFLKTASIFLVIGAAGSLVLLAASLFVPHGDLVVLAVPYFFFLLMNSSIDATFYALRRMLYLVLEQVLSKVFLIASLAVLVAAYGLTGALYSVSISIALTFLVLMLLLYFKFLKNYAAAKIELSLWDLVKFNMPLYLSNIIASAGPKIGVIMLTFYAFSLGSAEAGFFSLALSLIFAVVITVQTLPEALAPAIIEYHAKGEEKNISNAFVSSIRYTFMAFIPIVVASFFVADLAIESAFGPGYVAAAAPFKILMVSALFSITRRTITPVVVAFKKTKMFLEAESLSMVIFLAISALLIPSYGAMGAAAALAAGIVTGACLFVYKGMKIGNLRFPFSDVFKEILASLVFLVYLVYSPQNFVELIASALALSVVYIFLLRLFRVLNDVDIGRGIALLKNLKP